jgi:serine/threonine protein kinase
MSNSPIAPAASGASGPLPGPLEPGTVLQRRYQIERLIGGGGMGMVYLAHDQRLSNRPCALKEMVDHFIDPQQRIEANDYFAREADTLAQLKHPAIPAISDRFDDQNRHYLVMEYVEGRNLEEDLAARGAPLPEGLVIDVARQLCDVLAYLHGLSPPIIYRDMKPSNVMLTEKGRVVLVDFGIARLFKAARKGTMIGTLGFAPPEQYQGVADPRSDIYSLGATLHYVLTGRDPEKFPPFSFPPVNELRPDISRNLAGAIDHALKYEMADRPATVQDFRDTLLYGRGLEASGARVNSRSGTAGLSTMAIPPIALPRDAAVAVGHLQRRRKSWKRRVFGLATFMLLMTGFAFAATYIYSNPALQSQLGLTELIDNLPWKHEELVAKAREHPLDFQRLSLMLSTRSGSPLSPPKAAFTDTELANARYLKWDAWFNNKMAGLDGRSDTIEARFYDPNNVQIASSDDQRFVGPNETATDFSGVALLPDTTNLAPGSYRVALYSDNQLLTQQRFDVNKDLAAAAAAAESKKAADEAAAEAEAKRKAEAQRLAMIQEKMRRPLQLKAIEFVNSTKDGTVISGPSNVFNVSKVLFVGWKAVFQNELYGLGTNQYRVDAAYIGPDGSTLGSVDDSQTINQSASRAVFTGRVGNSAGGAFLPGQYTVNFYLNGQYFGQKRFTVVADAAGPYSRRGSNTGPSPGTYPASAPGGLETLTLAKGTIDGIGGHSNIPLDLRLRPQPNGFLHGEMTVHLAGYGPTPIEGFVRGERLQFQVPYGGETYYFEGQESRDQLSGTFESTPSGERGTWSTRAN